MTTSLGKLRMSGNSEMNRNSLLSTETASYPNQTIFGGQPDSIHEQLSHQFNQCNYQQKILMVDDDMEQLLRNSSMDCEPIFGFGPKKQ